MEEDQKYQYFKCILTIYNIIAKDKSVFNQITLNNIGSVKRKLNFIAYANEYDMLLEKTCYLFKYFEKEINDDNVQYLFNYDYTKLIEDDAYDENKQLIMNLITGVKEAWLKLNAKNQEMIKRNIKMCLTLSNLYLL